MVKPIGGKAHVRKRTGGVARSYTTAQEGHLSEGGILGAKLNEFNNNPSDSARTWIRSGFENEGSGAWVLRAMRVVATGGAAPQAGRDTRAPE